MPLPYPQFNPVALELGPIQVRWYGLAYVVGILGAWKYARYVATKINSALNPSHLDNFINWGIGGIILGGRLGHVVFFAPAYYLTHPLEIPLVWKGGMSFHGGLIGVGVALWLYCKRHHLKFFEVSDLWALGAPIGLFFGRLANFVNGELYGKVTTVPWGMLFEGADGPARQPSQLYEAMAEGVFLFALINFLFFKFTLSQKPGSTTGLFLVGYGLARYICEFYRESEWVYSSMGLEISSGQVLSLPLIFGGLWLLRRS